MNENVLMDLQRLTPRTEFDRVLMEDKNRRAQLEAQILYYPAISIIDAGRTVAVTGVTHENGVGQAWMVTGEGFDKAIRKVLRRHRKLLPVTAEILNLRRIHMLVDPQRPEAVRYAEAVGFIFESPMECMGLEGQDLWMFKKIFFKGRVET